MMKISRYLLVIFVSGIFVLSVSAVGAQQRYPAKAPQAATSDEEGGKAGIIVIDSVITDPKTVKKSKPRSAPKVEPGDTFQPQPGTKIEPGDNFQPGPGTKLEPGDKFQPRPGTNNERAIFNETEEAGPY
jgi:hypothetical protein